MVKFCKLRILLKTFVLTTINIQKRYENVFSSFGIRFSVIITTINVNELLPIWVKIIPG